MSVSLSPPVAIALLASLQCVSLPPALVVRPQYDARSLEELLSAHAVEEEKWQAPSPSPSETRCFTMLHAILIQTRFRKVCRI